jgi:Protein of unknown function (DUF1573)
MNVIKLLLFAALFLLGGSLAYLLLSSGRGLVGPAPPAILIAKDQVDLGRLRPNSTARGQVRIENHGGQPLVVERLALSCSCTEADLSNPLIAPGAGADISFSLKTRPGSGPGRESILVLSNDPNNPKAKIDVLFSVGEPFLIEPRSLDFGEVERGQLPQSVSGTLIANEAQTSLKDLMIGAVERPLTALLGPLESDGRRRLTVTLPPETPTGQVYATVEVGEAANAGSALKVDVHGYVRGEVQASPRTILLESAGAETPAQSVTLSARKGTLTVTGQTVSESLSKLVKVSVKQTDARSYQAGIAVEKDALPVVWKGSNRLAGQVLFQCSTDQGRRETVSVPILLFVEPKPKETAEANSEAR